TGLLVTAQLGPDLALVHSSWNEGIEAWRFQLPTEWQSSLTSAHTVLDRMLLRAGETVHMKHFVRRRTGAGFAPLPASELPEKVVLQHLGSDQKYELPLRWDEAGSAVTDWAIPKQARLGTYQIALASDRRGPGQHYHTSGSFRVEEYRVPLMTGSIQAPARQLVAPESIPLDLGVRFLAGGGAARLPVRVRYTVEPRFGVTFPS